MSRVTDETQRHRPKSVEKPEAGTRLSAAVIHDNGELIVPAVLGNVIGGVVMVALLNYGQVHQEREA